MQKITSRVRTFRKNSTKSEDVLWQIVRNSKIGFKIVRQKPIVIDYFNSKRTFIADFYCKEANVVIEVDGGVHAQQKEYDSLRTMVLSQKKLQVIRFTNAEIMSDANETINKIKQKILTTINQQSSIISKKPLLRERRRGRG